MHSFAFSTGTDSLTLKAQRPLRHAPQFMSRQQRNKPAPTVAAQRERVSSSRSTGCGSVSHRLALVTLAAPHPAARKHTSRGYQQRQRPRDQTILRLPGRGEIDFLRTVITLLLRA